MKDQTQRVLRASLISQKHAKENVLRGISDRIQSAHDDIRKWEYQIAGARDVIDSLTLQRIDVTAEVSEISDAYHDLWNEIIPQ
jgi:hypothetical protein